MGIAAARGKMNGPPPPSRHMRIPDKRRTTPADVFDTNPRTRAVLERARASASSTAAGLVDPTALLVAILDEDEARTADDPSPLAAVLTAIGTSAADLRSALDHSMAHRRKADTAPSRGHEYTSRALNALRLAMANARRRRETGGGGPVDLLLAIMADEGGSTWKASARAGVTRERVADALEEWQESQWQR